MQYLLFILIYPFLWCISILPFRILYLFSDFVYFIVYRFIGYRKKTVRENIALALPKLTFEERIIIEKKFYRHLCDLFLEMIKTMSISKDEISKRYQFTNIEVYKEIENKGKSIVIMCAHYASYEWAVSLNFHSNFKSFGIYKKIKNPYFDKLVHSIRSKFKANLITTKETIPTISTNNKNNILSMYGFASDQSPKANVKNYYAKFMGIDVPVYTSAEMLAKKYNMNVVFLKTKKVKRGYYEATIELLSDNVNEIPNFELTHRFLNLVEKQIYEAPEYYLWTHKRWKLRR